MARRYRVEVVLQAQDSIALADVQKDFMLVPEGETSLERVRDDPNISLYCLGRHGNSVAFVETPPGIDYHAAPLSYQAQRNHAVAVHELTLEEFGRIASDIRLADTDLLLIFSVGRCGSTLLHHILNRSTGVRSLSEPDFFSNVQQLGPGCPREPKMSLLRDAARVLVLKSQARDRLFAIKFRSENCAMWELLYNAFDRPLSMFLYRDVVETVRSYDRLFGVPLRQPHAMLLSLSAKSHSFRILYKLIFNVGNRGHGDPRTIGHCEYSPHDLMLEIGPKGFYVLAWLRKVAAYLRALERSENSAFALRFEDLVGQCEATVENLFAKLGLPSDEAACCCEVLKRDAHEDTFLSRTSAPHDINGRTVEAIEARIGSIDCLGGYPALLPNTIRP